MKKVLITGANEFLGEHVRWFLLQHKDTVVWTELESGAFDNETAALREALQSVDAVFHLDKANSSNTAQSEDIIRLNTNRAQTLVDVCTELSLTPHILYASSIHRSRDDEYGRSMKLIGDIFSAWGEEHSAKTTAIVIPNEFGEWGAPYTTSVVSTFCHEIATGKTSTVGDATIPLIYAQDIAHAFYEALTTERVGDVELEGTPISIADIYSTLKEQYDSYCADIVPAFASPLHLQLFNTLRTHLFSNNFYPRPYVLKSDARGSLFETIKEKCGGQSFVSTTVPGAVRGNHYHYRKIERFAVLQGTATINIRKLLSEEMHTFEVSGEEPVYIDMPTFTAHNLENTSTNNVLALFWTNELYNPEDPDTFPEML